MTHLYLYSGCTILGALARRQSLRNLRVFGDLLLLRVVVVVVLSALAESRETVSSKSMPVIGAATTCAASGIGSSSVTTDCSSLLSLELFSVIVRRQIVYFFINRLATSLNTQASLLID